jgi:hypothetical protein
MPEVEIRVAGPPGFAFDEENAEELVGQEFPIHEAGVPRCVGRIVAAVLDDDPRFIRATLSASWVPEGYEDMTPELLMEARPAEGDEGESFRYWSA